MISESKNEAKQSLKGVWNDCAIIALVVGIALAAIATVITFVFTFANLVVAIFLTPAIEISVAYIGLNLYRKIKNPQFSDMTEGFKCYSKSLEIGIRKYVVIFLYTLLLIIPGIIKKYAYSFANFIMLDDKDITPKDAIKKSEELTNGNKMDLFLLDLSFIGWYLLSAFTCGILALWIVPYHNIAKVAYYQKLRAKKFGDVGVYVEQVKVLEDDIFNI
ncbi:MAG: DUF975 family protein [Bacillota bacterium]